LNGDDKEKDENDTNKELGELDMPPSWFYFELLFLKGFPNFMSIMKNSLRERL
jgi:hypothetical protein